MEKIGLVFIIFEFIFVQAIRNSDLVFVIISQEENNLSTEEELKFEICQQTSIEEDECPPIYLSHKDFPHVGGWTLIPILNKIYEISKNSSWLIILEDRSMIRLEKLKKLLEEYDDSKELWIGHALEDSNPTIIHHFHDVEFMYPHMGAGIAITIPLLQRLSTRTSVAGKTIDFNIDRSYEFAMFIWNEANRTSLIHNDAFCSSKKENCAVFPKEFKKCDMSITAESIYFVVKTCSKFHSIRVPTVLSTWARYAKKLDFISDKEDNSIPTISLGIPNTESGHCGKTMAIIKYIFEKIKDNNSIKWAVITDDDTILSVHRIIELLSCYNSDNDVAIGERYGYGVYNSHGFNYITGGGGMVFSRTLLEKLSATCKCPSISSPDDMILGLCLSNLGVEIIHSHLFHQARPIDYSPRFLESDRHVSFHKHWMIDPIKVYEEWFAQEDLKLVKTHTFKTEL